MKAADRIGQLAQSGTLTLLLATVLVVPLLVSPDMWAWRGVKPVLFEVLTLLLVGLALMQAVPQRRRILEFLRAGPNLPVLLLVLCGPVSWARSSSPELSRPEWIRLACGAGLYFVVAGSLRQREQVKTLLNVLIAVAILTSLFGFATYAQSDLARPTSSFGDGQLFAGFLLLLVPV